MSSYSRYANTLLVALDIARKSVVATARIDGAATGSDGSFNEVWLLDRGPDGDVVRRYFVSLAK